MMVLLIALFALPAKAANGPGDLYLAYQKNSVWNYSKFEQNSTDVYTCTHTFGASEKFYIVKGVNAANEPSKSKNTYEVNAYDVSNGYSKTLYLYDESQGAFTCTNEGTYTLKVDFTSSADPTFTFSSKITKPTYNVSIVGYVGQESWTDNGTKLSNVGNGIYRGEVDLKGSRYFRVIIDGSKFGPNSDTSDKFVAEGTTETIYMNKDSRAFQAPILNKYVVSVDVYNNTVTIPTNVYLVGDVTGGWDTSKGWKFDTTDGVTYTLTGKDINANSNFKILAGSSWLSSCNQSITVPYNATLIDGSGTDGNKNMRLSSNVTNVNITFNLSTKAFSIESADTPTTYTYSIKGTIDGSNWGTHAMTENNGVWEWTATVKAGSFGIQKLDKNGKQVNWIWSADKASISAAGVYNAVIQNGNNGANWSSTLAGEYTFSFNPETMKLTISAKVSVDKYYVKYSSDGWNSHEMERQSDGTYTYKMTNPSSGCELAMQKNGTAEANDFWTNSADNTYTGGTKSFTMEGTSSKNIVFGDGLSGEYTLTYTPSSKTLTISGGEVSHKPYYFVGDMNDWFSKEFTDPTAHIGMDKDMMNANKKNWEFTFIDEIPERGELGKGWYEFDIECLTGQFQIFDGTDALWEGEVYSHDPYVRGYGDHGGKDHDSFKAYINRPISKDMISGFTVMTTTTTKGGKPAIRRNQGSNFHLGCNAVRNAKIYFLPGNDPKLIVSGTPEDYYIFYSKANKNEDTSDGKVTAQIVNGKPNTNNYYLPGVKYDNVALPNYINEDGTTAAHMNMDGIDLVEFDFSAKNIDTTFNSDAFRSMFNTASVGGMTLDDFKNNLKNNQKLPNGISLNGRTTVYVQKIPNGFEYPAGRKYALQFINAFSSSDKDVLTPVAASNLYFFNDAVHVNFNIDNYEKGAQEKDRFVKMYYRIYTYDENYNTVVINTDNGTKEQIHSKGEEIGLTAGSSTKDLGWVALNEKKAPSAWGGTTADTGYSNLEAWNVAWVNNNRKHIDSKYGNCYIQFKVETGPNPSQASAANRANAEESDHGTLYIPERALIRNTPEFYTFNGKDLYVALDGGYTTTDVEDVFEDQIVEEGVDAEPIFFNLQGQRVVNPEKGMYIVVKGNKTYKVMIK